MKHRIFIICVLLVFIFTASSLFSTGQAGDDDRLLYEGEEYSIRSNPLEDYFIEYGNKSYRPMEIIACWRSYITFFEVKDDFLYLNRVIKFSGKEIRLSYIFPGQKSPIKADWFSGIIRIPKKEGETIVYHMNMGPLLYEKEIHLEFEKGKLIESVTIDNVEIINNFMNLPEIKKKKQKLIEKGCEERWVYLFLLFKYEKMLMDGAINDPEFKNEIAK